MGSRRPAGADGSDSTGGTQAAATSGRTVRAFGGYQPGLDGVRGLSVLAIVAYHAELPGADGAFLGVSQFFTLSGFLITAILLDEQARTGSIDLKRFWTRRVRRLAPAALLGLVIAMVFGATIATRSQADQLPEHVIGAATYVVNWVFIQTDQSYTDLFSSPSPLQHYWSLAIEEQFYLLMPVGLVLVFKLGASDRVIGILFALGVALTTGWMWFLYDDGASLDRLYYGTDTRIGEVLVGAVVAVVLHRVGSSWSESTRRGLAALGVPAVIVTLWLWTTVSLSDPFVWQGGFLLHALLSVVIMLAVLAGRGPLAGVFSFGPLVQLGRISYGVYVVHWPVFLWLDADRLDLDQWPLFAVRLAVTLVLAVLSFRLLEMPIRDGATLGVSDRIRPLVGPAVALAIVGGTVVTVSASASDPFETLRGPEGSLGVPIATADGVLDVLVLSGAGDDGVVDEIGRLADDEPAVEVHVGATFECVGGAVTTASGRTCANWATEWPALVATHDPDVVVLYADGWAGDDLASLGDGDDGSDADLAAELLDGGFDLLAAEGASVVTSGSGVDFAEAIRRSFGPYQLALDMLEPQRSDLFHVLGDQLPVAGEVSPEEFRAQSASALLTNAALYQRSPREGLPRVLVVGDSQSRSLGYGLERWAAEEGRAWVWNVAVEGCGYLPDGFVEGFGGEQPLTEQCQSVRDVWAEQISRFEPDLVISLSSVFDLADRRLEAWDEPAGVGDPLFDEYMLEEYEAAVDTLTATGADLLWLQPPCAELRSGQPGQDATVLDPERIEHINEVILPELVRRRPDAVELFDLFEVLCPGGVAIDSIEGVGELRFDGVHFSVEGSLWFAREYGSSLLEKGTT